MSSATAATFTPAVRVRPRSLVWHQIRKDLRRHRAVLVPWLATLALLPFLPLANEGAPLLELALGPFVDILVLAVTARIVFEDPLGGPPRAFWRTLPISSRTLLAAKVTLLAALVWLPVLLAQAASLAVLAVPAGQWPVALAYAALWEAGLILSAAVVAALTNGYLQMFLVMGAGVAMAFAPEGLYLARLTASGPPWIGIPRWCLSYPAWGPPAAVLQALPLFLAAAGLVGLHWRRRTRVSVRARIGGGVVLLLAWAIVVHWASFAHVRDAAGVRRPAVQRALLDTAVRLELDHAAEAGGPGAGGRSRSLVGGHFVRSDSLRNFRLTPTRIRSRFDRPDGRSTSSEFTTMELRQRDDAESEAGLWGALGLALDNSLTRRVNSPWPLFEAPRETTDAPGGDPPGRLLVEVVFAGNLYESTRALPLRVGARASVGGNGVCITSVRSSRREGLALFVRVTQMESFTEDALLLSKQQFALRLPNRAAPVRLEKEFAGFGIRLLTGVPRLEIASLSFRLDADRLAELGLTGDPAELAGAGLLVASQVNIGSVTRNIEFEGFRPADW